MLTSSCGGPFGMAYKTAGYDGLLITGKSEKPIVLEIDSNGVKFQDAAHLWGKDTLETQQALSSNRKTGVLAIGPAGENRVRYANIASGHRFLGRGGMGAVMGAKNLKAIVAHGGTYRILPHKPDKFKAVCKKATQYIQANHYTGNLYRNFGTNANTRPCNAAGLIPVNNFRRGSDTRAESISGQTIQKKYSTSFDTCKPCTILCGHKGTYPDGSEHHIPEYESVHLLGPNLGIFDTDRITEFNDICGRMGLDTISSGATLSYIMEAGGKGLIETNLEFGSPEGIADTLLKIAHCYLLSESRAPERLMRLTQALLGWLPGGLAMVALTACALLTAFTGASGVTIVALGALLYPALIRAGYQENFSLGLVTTSGSLGLLFAPSLPLILYGVIAQQMSVGRSFTIDELFLAGIMPGLYAGHAVGLELLAKPPFSVDRVHRWRSWSFCLRPPFHPPIFYCP